MIATLVGWEVLFLHCLFVTDRTVLMHTSSMAICKRIATKRNISINTHLACGDALLVPNVSAALLIARPFLPDVISGHVRAVTFSTIYGPEFAPFVGNRSKPVGQNKKQNLISIQTYSRTRVSYIDHGIGGYSEQCCSFTDYLRLIR